MITTTPRAKCQVGCIEPCQPLCALHPETKPARDVYDAQTLRKEAAIAREEATHAHNPDITALAAKLADLNQRFATHCHFQTGHTEQLRNRLDRFRESLANLGDGVTTWSPRIQRLEERYAPLEQRLWALENGRGISTPTLDVPEWVDVITIHYTEDDECQVAFLTTTDSGNSHRADGFGATRQQAWAAAITEANKENQ